MTNPILRFHVVGEWDQTHVRTVWGDSSHSVPAEVQELIEETWQRASARPGVKLFDGPMCRMEKWAARTSGGREGADGGVLELVLSRTSYKSFMGTNLSHPELADRYGREVLANPVGVSPALETSDGLLMLGRRNASVAYYPSRIHPFAGCLEPVESFGMRDGGRGQLQRPGAAPDVFAAIRRELFEELGFANRDVAEVHCAGVAEDLRLRQPELIFRVKTPRTRSQIEAQVARDEHHESWSIPATPAGVEPALADPRLTPVAVASLLLWGRGAFGTDWFHAQAAKATGPPIRQ